MQKLFMLRVILIIVSVNLAECLLSSPNGSYEALALRIQQLEDKVAILESQKASADSGPVAFTASLMETITNVSTHQQIVFDRVITNIGNGYNPSHGHFVAPVRGAYVFFVSLTNMPEHSSSARLLKNGTWIGHVLAHGNANNPGLYVTSTLAATVQLDIGDEVWVQNEYEFSTVEEINGYDWSTFSGHLIKAN